MTSNTIADAAHRCLASFDAISHVSVTHVPGSLPIEDGRSRYDIWASNLGSLHPGTDRRSADYRLREAPEVVERIVELLEELTEINSEVLEILAGERTNRQISESEDDLESSDELSELNLSVGDIITSLFKVSMLVKKATTRDRYAKAASAKEAAFLAEFDIRHVADKYPKLQTQPWLLERLGNAITQRRQFLRYCRNHKHRIAHVAPREALPDELLPRPAHTDGKLDIPAHTANAASTTNTPLTRPTLTPTTASTLHPDRIGPEDLQDLDRDDAVSQVTSVAYSQMDPDDSGILHVPRLEDVLHGDQPGQPFECPLCFGIVQARRQHSWRKHVLSDLRAYVCISADCDAGLFEDKTAWQAHDAECHQRQWSCNQCRSGPFTSAKSLQHHLHSTHDIGKLPDDVVTKIVDASSHSVSEAAPSCPFCDFEDKVRNDATARGQELLPNAQVTIPLAEYHRHLAFHQEQLALFAIPPEVERSVESGSNHGRSKADPQEGIQFMARWQNLLDITDITDNQDSQDVMATDVPTLEESMSSNNLPSSKRDDRGSTQAPAMGDSSIYMPAEGLFPSILPGDIVYIPQENDEQLSYKKGVYLGRNKDNKHTARDWNSKSEIEVSLATLVRKTDCTAEEKREAASLRTHQPLGAVEFQPRQYRKNHILTLRACDTLLFEASRLAHGDREITGYDEGFVKPIFSNFARRFSQRNVTNGVRLEDIVRMFYATATSEQSKDATSSDAMWKADAERSAALLMKVLIEIVEDQYIYDKDVVAELRSEQAQMIIRANEAVKLASSSYFRQSFTDRQSTFDDVEGNHLEIDFPSLEALKLRLQSVAAGQEQLPGFGDDDVKRTFKTFSQFMEALPVAGTSRVEDIVRDFRRCAIHETKADNTLDRDQRNAIVRRQEALLLSLLISVDARMQFELHGSAPRIRSRFTTILMEERARLSFSASRSDALSTTHGLGALTGEPETNHSDALHTKESVDPVMERPPRELRCYSCQHTWTSISGAELRDCPNCGSYSVFAESPRRTASPDPGVHHRASATGEEALGQYFSERTDKYMNLYRQQPLPKSTSDSHESLPNPWEHLHTSSNTSLAKGSRTPPQEVERAQTEQFTRELSLEDSPNITVAQWDGMQEVLQHISDYRAEDGSAPSKWFHHKVNPQIIPDYYGIIKEPMALSTIKQKIDTRAYQSVREFVRDFALISFNAQAFNRPDSSAYRNALVVERELKDQLRMLVESGVFGEEDSILPDLGSVLDYDDSPDRDYGSDGPGSENLLAMDAGMRFLREEQNNAGKPLQSSTDTSQRKANRMPTQQLIAQSKLPYAAGSAAALAALQDSLASYHQDKKPESNLDAESVSAEEREPGTRIHHLGIAPSQLLDLIINIRNTTAILQLLQEQHSRNQGDLPEAVDQLLSLNDGFKRLAELQENPDYQLRFQRVQKNVHVLCSSVRYTIATVLNTLHIPLHETQWVALMSSMRYIEHADILERLRWYQAALAGLLDHLDGFTSESLLGMDPNIRSLLERQRSVERSGGNTGLPKTIDDEQSESSPKASTSETEAEPVNPIRPSEISDPSQPQDQASAVQPFTHLTVSTSRVLNILRILQMHHSRDSTIVPEIIDDLQSLLTSFQKLSQFRDDSQYEPNFVKLQEPIKVLCRSTQHTLDAMLQVLTAEPPSDETMLMQLTMLIMRMTAEEKVGLPERLRWYSASVLGLLNHLEGFPSAGRIFQWLGMDEKVRSLLERQEGSRE